MALTMETFDLPPILEGASKRVRIQVVLKEGEVEVVNKEVNALIGATRPDSAALPDLGKQTQQLVDEYRKKAAVAASEVASEVHKLVDLGKEVTL